MMNILCDVHIAFKIAKWFSRKGCNAIHVNMILNKSETTDAEICRYADENNFIVITKDADFKSSFFILNTPRKLIKVNLGNVSNTTLIELFEKNYSLIEKIADRKRFYIEMDKNNTSFNEFEE